MDHPTVRSSDILGFDLGRNYLAWGVVRIQDGVITPYRYGLIKDIELFIGSSASNLIYLKHFIHFFIQSDARPIAISAERFVHRPGGGASSEDVNLLVALIAQDPRVKFVRNTDWKRRVATVLGCAPKTDVTATLKALYGTPTPHEADALGIATALAAQLHAATLPKPRRKSRQQRTPKGDGPLTG